MQRQATLVNTVQKTVFGDSSTSFFQVSQSRNVCIFCAARSSGKLRRPQYQSLHSSHSPATALGNDTTSREDSDSLPVYNESWGHFRSHGGSRARGANLQDVPSKRDPIDHSRQWMHVKRRQNSEPETSMELHRANTAELSGPPLISNTSKTLARFRVGQQKYIKAKDPSFVGFQEARKLDGSQDSVDESDKPTIVIRKEPVRKDRDAPLHSSPSGKEFRKVRFNSRTSRSRATHEASAIRVRKDTSSPQASRGWGAWRSLDLDKSSTESNNEPLSSDISRNQDDDSTPSSITNLPTVERSRSESTARPVPSTTRDSQTRRKISPPSFKSDSMPDDLVARKQARKSRPRNNDFEDDFDEDEESRAERRLQRRREKAAQKARAKAAVTTPISLPIFISASNLASLLKVKIEDLMAKAKSLGFDKMPNDHILDAEASGLIAEEFNFEPTFDKVNHNDLQARSPPEEKSHLPPRPPVITIMGHVDHGKTTMLDWLRKSSVAASEHGGITQHIGAFSVEMPSGKRITFLDTPGHAAFLSMRQRGANVTDIIILVVAADDSVKPQTIEAIKHAKAANVPIIVAITKVDKEDANVERVRQDLAQHEIYVEDFGGDTQVVAVSGKTGQGMTELEDAAIALADIIDMRAETDGQAEGWVLEATTKKAGRVATVLVRRGTIAPGSYLVAGSTWAKVRVLRNEAGVQVRSAGPGTPVEIDGWRELPDAGDEVLEAPDEHTAKSVTDGRIERAETERLAVDVAAINESRRLAQARLDREEQIAKGQAVDEEEERPSVKELCLIVKADVYGSVEAVVDSVSALGNEEVRPNILRSAAGAVNQSDIDHASAANAQIISFNIPVESSIARAAADAGVFIIEQNIIYKLADDIKDKLSDMLEPLTTSRVVGEAEISQIFDITVARRATLPIAGCKVRNGSVAKHAKARVSRNDETVFDGMYRCSSNVAKMEYQLTPHRHSLLSQEP